MRKIVSIGLTGLAIIAIGSFVALRDGGLFSFRTIEAKEEAGKQDVSEKLARSLQQKIDALKAASEDPKHKSGSSRMEVSEAELESYLLYSLKEEIPAQIDSADVQLSPDTVALETQITFSSGATGNSVVDALVGGTHNLFVKGKLVASNAVGKFDLLDVRVDSIPVPNSLIQTLIKKYVNPKYPEVDINEPFDMPWGIQSVKVDKGKATIVY